MRAHESHTWQEIVSQPQVWRATLDAFEAGRYVYPRCSAWPIAGRWRKNWIRTGHRT